MSAEAQTAEMPRRAQAHAYAALCAAVAEVTDTRRARTTARLAPTPGRCAVATAHAYGEALTTLADRRAALLLARGHAPAHVDCNGFLVGTP